MPIYPKLKSGKIKYDSPSGYVHIGKYIPPFEKVKNGFGYMGVLLIDFESGKLMCNECGKWFENLSTHITSVHNISCKDYKIKFGLLLQTALKSKKMRLFQSKVMQKLRGKNKANRSKFQKNNLFAGNRKNQPKAVESRNKYGVCDLQLVDRITALKKELNKTPTLTQLKERYGNTFVSLLNKRYGSYVKLCRRLDLEPNYSNHNPKYNREYFIEKALSNSPSTRILTINEQAGFYKHFNSINELKEIVNELKENEDYQKFKKEHKEFYGDLAK